MPSKIESSLTPEQFHDFCSAIASMKGGRKGATLKEIARVAGEWGIGYVSEKSASTFRDGAFKDFLDDLKSSREMAADMANVAQAGLGLDEAASKVLEKKLFKTALALSDNVDPETADFLTKSVERLRTGNRSARRLEADLELMKRKVSYADERVAVLERERKDWEEQKKKVASAADQLRTATPASADEIRAKVVATLDDVMGITPKK
jgi:hypothetical protein